MKAIRTTYNNQEYRSKLEAQYAKGMDLAGIKFIYEPEGFEFSDGTKYLPDFYLPEYDCFLEVKGVMSEKDKHKIDMLRKESGKRVLVADGGDVVLDRKTPELGPIAYNTFWFNSAGYSDDSKGKYIKTISTEYDNVLGGVLFIKDEGYLDNPNDVPEINRNNIGKCSFISLKDYDNPFLMVCPECGKKTIHDCGDGWSCGWCGYYDGNRFDTVCLDDYANEIKETIISPAYIDYRSNQ